MRLYNSAYTGPSNVSTVFSAWAEILNNRRVGRESYAVGMAIISSMCLTVELNRR